MLADLGTLLTDIEDVKVHSSVLATGRTLHATADSMAIKHHRYEGVRFEDFIRALSATPLPSFPPHPLPVQDRGKFEAPSTDAPVTLHNMFGYLDEHRGDCRCG